MLDHPRHRGNGRRQLGRAVDHAKGAIIDHMAAVALEGGATLLAQGSTTREAAAAIFLSPKTVEYHLRHVYQKLGINSRDELAAHFAAPD